MKPRTCQRCGYTPDSPTALSWSRWQRKCTCLRCHFKGRPANFRRYTMMPPTVTHQ